LARSWRLAESRIRIAPSLLAADFGQLREQVATIEAGGAQVLHLDIMDGHFVPNISFGVPVIEKLRSTSKLFFDTHLMIDDPLGYAEAFVKAGSENLTFHIEIGQEPGRVIDRIRSLGASVGMSLNPGTPAAVIEPFIPHVNLVLVMSVWPGFGGQTFIVSVLDKMTKIRQWLRPDQRLEVDGGIAPDTVGLAARAGADTFVAGTCVFGRPDCVAAMEELKVRAEASALR
jgi:ribulose-phosphate 3-epimerase